MPAWALTPQFIGTVLLFNIGMAVSGMRRGDHGAFVAWMGSAGLLAFAAGQRFL